MQREMKWEEVDAEGNEREMGGGGVEREMGGGRYRGK